MPVRTYQSTHDYLKTPPLAPPFPEGWQAERAFVRVPSRTAAVEDWRYGYVAPPPTLGGTGEWGLADRSFPRLPPRALAVEDWRYLKTPPLAPPFPEGWQAGRAFVWPPFRTLVMEDWRLLIPPPPLPEGWYSERAFVRPPSRTAVLESWHGLLPPGPLPEGWQAERAFVRPPSRSLAVEDWRFAFVAPPPTLPKGWYSERVFPKTPSRALPVEDWRYGYVAPPPVIPGTGEWGLADRVFPRPPSRSLTWDVPLLLIVPPPPVVPVQPVPQPGPPVVVLPPVGDVIDDDTLAAVLARWLADSALNSLFDRPPEAGVVKSPAGLPRPLPYARISCRFLSREMAGSAGAFHDYRRVTLEVWGVRADAVAALRAVMAVFNRDVVLTYPTTYPLTGLPRFVRWWPADGGSLTLEAEAARGRDVWRASASADVWSIRPH